MTLDHRRATVEVTVLDPAGEPLRDAEVTVEQQRHDFAFGNIGFDVVPMDTGKTEQDAAVESVLGGAGPAAGLPDLEAVWLELFTTATLPFSRRGFEPTCGTRSMKPSSCSCSPQRRTASPGLCRASVAYP
ncbi:hypothetical protein [Arthrobacter sp. RIT-PI-e]|uniref:hypothetical protein n=1 Tax=Arthrobacter sp. RIT-PI-e TaxID=1681197 RepID=UPI00067685B8|nr:hypothetical protein [Arthrobacter sp. RIT-PI-e]